MSVEQLTALAVLDAFKAAGEETRLRILLLLNDGELTVSDIARVLGQSQPRISRHIKVLLDARLIERQKEGSWTLLRLAEHSAPLDVIMPALQSISPIEPERQGDLAALGQLKSERLERAQAYFAAHAADWSIERSLHVDEQRVEASMTTLMAGEQFDKLIDLGTGTARILELFAGQVRSGLGIDANADMLGYARSRIAQSPHRHLRVARGDLYHLGQYRQHADFVTMHQVLHFLTHPGSALRTAASLLRPDGKILIVDFAPHNLDQLRETSGHVRLGIAHEQMERWLAEADLELLQAETLPPDNDPDDQQLTVSLWLARRMGDKALAA